MEPVPTYVVVTLGGIWLGLLTARVTLFLLSRSARKRSGL
jgi:hypothetical protein